MEKSCFVFQFYIFYFVFLFLKVLTILLLGLFFVGLYLIIGLLLTINQNRGLLPQQGDIVGVLPFGALSTLH